MSMLQFKIMGKIKYTKELLSALVSRHKNVADIVRELGLRVGSGVHGHICKKIREFEIDIRHFVGMRSSVRQESNKKKHYSEILRKRVGLQRRREGYQLTRALIEFGRKHECELCSQGPVWNSQPLTLQVDHRNGDVMDDRPTNLRFLCPNCHTQTPDYGTRKEKKKCSRCKVAVLCKGNKSGSCATCYPIWRRGG